MQRDGLVELDQDDRHLVLTPLGSELATRVMRKHRLAECLLVDVIGLPWEEVHAEACRWEHVMSEAVERRLLSILDHPTSSPFGNPIPGLAELEGPQDAGGRGPAAAAGSPLSALAAEDEPRTVTVLRIGETLQGDELVMADLRRLGATPGGAVQVTRTGDRVRIGGEDDSLELPVVKAVQIIAAAR
jgi:DtxR family Mn-dependent transcriptional regulator